MGVTVTIFRINTNIIAEDAILVSLRSFALLTSQYVYIVRAGRGQ